MKKIDVVIKIKRNRPDLKDTYASQNNKLWYSVDDKNNLSIIQDGYEVALYPKGIWKKVLSESDQGSF